MELLKLLKLLQLVDAWSSFQTLIIRTEKIFYDVSKYCSWVAVVYDNVRMIICTYIKCTVFKFGWSSGCRSLQRSARPYILAVSTSKEWKVAERRKRKRDC